MNTSSSWDLDLGLQRVFLWLAPQGPIKDIVAQNPLQRIQNLSFQEAIESASEIFGARNYLPLSWYQEAYQKGRISDSALQHVAKLKEMGDSQKWWSSLFEVSSKPKPQGGVSRLGIRIRRHQRMVLDLDALVQPFLFRVLSAYLDQGISLWEFPRAEEGFWVSVRELFQGAQVDLLSAPQSKRLLALSADEAIAFCLDKLVGDSRFYDQYLLELALGHPGWSGMACYLENNPSTLISPRSIRLKEVLALELILELEVLERNSDGPLVSEKRYLPKDPISLSPEGRQKGKSELLSVWHEALEWSLYESLIGLLDRNLESPSLVRAPAWQAVFCIDDRCCSVRRHLEAIDQDVATFSTVGFFGMDFLFQPAGSLHAFQYCPIVLKPKHVVKETVEIKRARLGSLLHLTPHSNTLFRGWIVTQIAGVVSLLQLARNILQPNSNLLSSRDLTHLKYPTQFNLLRENDTLTPEGYFEGYSLDEMAERVHRVLASMGMTQFSDLVFIVAHGSSTANNPHFSAYDCGACSGKPGSPNARAFAWMANQAEVRKRVEKLGIAISDRAHFLGAMHDTTSDEIHYFDSHLIPASHRDLLERAQEAFKQALGNNALERCQHFDLNRKITVPEKAQKHAINRSRSIFEPRPELTHSGNAFCVVGRRALTQGLSLNRRAFLHSYDPALDPTGGILGGILGAVVPVCGGINLAYYFSRLDSNVYGAGTKLSHNIISLLGVANGVEGDLLVGFPFQMVDLHDPIRLMILIEQEPQLVLDTVRKDAVVHQWVHNEWVRLCSFSPSLKKYFVFRAGQMQLWPEDILDRSGLIPNTVSELFTLR